MSINDKREKTLYTMQQTLVILKPSAIARGFVGPILERFQRKGLIISGMKMMQLDEQLLREHYAHLVDRPFSLSFWHP